MLVNFVIAMNFHPKIHTAVQQSGFKRVKRGFRTLKSPAAISNYPGVNDVETESSSKIPTDPYFPLQWYLRNTGQNGGKVRLDLNVQAAWDQGITGKNVTTAIMDDGKYLLSQICTLFKVLVDKYLNSFIYGQLEERNSLSISSDRCLKKIYFPRFLFRC